LLGYHTQQLFPQETHEQRDLTTAMLIPSKIKKYPGALLRLGFFIKNEDFLLKMNYAAPHSRWALSKK